MYSNNIFIEFIKNTKYNELFSSKNRIQILVN